MAMVSELVSAEASAAALTVVAVAVGELLAVDSGIPGRSVSDFDLAVPDLAGAAVDVVGALAKNVATEESKPMPERLVG